MKTIAKITRKGQVTIAKKIRDLLGSYIIEFKVQKENIIIKPVKSVGGSLHKYSKRYVSFEDIRDTVWEEVVKKNRLCSMLIPNNLKQNSSRLMKYY